MLPPVPRCACACACALGMGKLSKLPEAAALAAAKARQREGHMVTHPAARQPTRWLERGMGTIRAIVL